MVVVGHCKDRRGRRRQLNGPGQHVLTARNQHLIIKVVPLLLLLLLLLLVLHSNPLPLLLARADINAHLLQLLGLLVVHLLLGLLLLLVRVVVLKLLLALLLPVRVVVLLLFLPSGLLVAVVVLALPRLEPVPVSAVVIGLLLDALLSPVLVVFALLAEFLVFCSCVGFCALELPFLCDEGEALEVVVAAVGGRDERQGVRCCIED